MSFSSEQDDKEKKVNGQRLVDAVKGYLDGSDHSLENVKSILHLHIDSHESYMSDTEDGKVYTPLMMAVKPKNVELAMELLKHVENGILLHPTTTESNYETALAIAIEDALKELDCLNETQAVYLREDGDDYKSNRIAIAILEKCTHIDKRLLNALKGTLPENELKPRRRSIVDHPPDALFKKISKKQSPHGKLVAKDAIEALQKFGNGERLVIAAQRGDVHTLHELLGTGKEKAILQEEMPHNLEIMFPFLSRPRVNDTVKPETPPNVDLNFRESTTSRTALMWAAQNSYTEIATELLKQVPNGLRLHVTSKDDNFETALSIAIKKNIDIAQMIVKSCINVVPESTNLASYCQACYDGEVLCLATQRGEVETIKTLLEKPNEISIQFQESTRSWTALMWAASIAKPKQQKIGRLLIGICKKYKFNLELINKATDDDCALTIAARSKNIEMGRLLMTEYSIAGIKRAAKNEPSGMFEIFAALELERMTDQWTNLNTVYYGETRYCLVNESPEELEYGGEHGIFNNIHTYNDSSVVTRYNTNCNYLSLKRFNRWMLELLNKKKRNYQIEEYYVPISPNTEFLEIFLDTSNKLSDPLIFDNEVIREVVGYAWVTYGQYVHLFTMLLYIALLSLVTLSNFNFQIWIDGDILYRDRMWGVMVTILILDIYFLIGESFQFIESLSSVGSMIRYATDFQNYIDWSALVLTLVACSMRLHVHDELNEARILMSVATCLLWFKFLYYLRPYASTGKFIRMLYYILYSIKALLFILAILIFAFSQAMYLLSNPTPDSDFSNRQESIIRSFLYMMGGSDLNQMKETINTDLAQFLLCIFIFMTTILMLNLLIALMNSSYSTIESQQESEWVKERAEIILEQWRPWAWILHSTSTPKAQYFYLLTRADDHNKIKKATINRKHAQEKALETRVHRIEKLLSDTIVDKSNNSVSTVPRLEKLESLLMTKKKGDKVTNDEGVSRLNELDAKLTRLDEYLREKLGNSN